MRTLKRHPRGSAILGLLMCFIIVAILSGMYLGPATGGKGPGSNIPWMLTLPDRTRSSVCDANRRTMLTNLILDQTAAGGNNQSPAQMAQTAAKLSRCPGDGRYYVEGDEVDCTAHTLTPKFRERLNLTL